MQVPTRCWSCGRSPLDSAAGCGPCAERAQPNAAAWAALRDHLMRHWNEVVRRGAVDLSRVFAADVGHAALAVHLHFVWLAGSRFAADGIAVKLDSFAESLMRGSAHPEITLLLADARGPVGRLVSHDSSVSVLRSGDAVESALWTHLVHPVAIKVCYLKAGAPVLAPPGSHPWHPLRQRKIVKLSPYRGDTASKFARRDLRI